MACSFCQKYLDTVQSPRQLSEEQQHLRLSFDLHICSAVAQAWDTQRDIHTYTHTDTTTHAHTQTDTHTPVWDIFVLVWFVCKSVWLWCPAWPQLLGHLSVSFPEELRCPTALPFQSVCGKMIAPETPQLALIAALTINRPVFTRNYGS